MELAHLREKIILGRFQFLIGPVLVLTYLLLIYFFAVFFAEDVVLLSFKPETHETVFAVSTIHEKTRIATGDTAVEKHPAVAAFALEAFVEIRRLFHLMAIITFLGFIGTVRIEAVL